MSADEIILGALCGADLVDVEGRVNKNLIMDMCNSILNHNTHIYGYESWSSRYKSNPNSNIFDRLWYIGDSTFDKLEYYVPAIVWGAYMAMRTLNGSTLSGLTFGGYHFDEALEMSIDKGVECIGFASSDMSAAAFGGVVSGLTFCVGVGLNIKDSVELVSARASKLVGGVDHYVDLKNGLRGSGTGILGIVVEYISGIGDDFREFGYYKNRAIQAGGGILFCALTKGMALHFYGQIDPSDERLISKFKCKGRIC